MERRNNIDPERWVEEHGDYLYRYALARLRDAATAQDMVQETFLAAFRGAARFSGQSTEKTWLVGILKHKVVDFIRKASRERVYEDVSEAEDRVDDSIDRKGHWKTGEAEWRVHPQKAYEQREFWGVFEACLDKLQERLRIVFSRRELEGSTAEEICNELNITATNLWVMLYRARTKLKLCLEENWFAVNP